MYGLQRVASGGGGGACTSDTKVFGTFGPGCWCSRREQVRLESRDTAAASLNDPWQLAGVVRKQFGRELRSGA